MASCVGLSSMLLVGFAVFMPCFVPVHSALFFSMEPCPEGIAKNETWYPDVLPGSSNNAKADCLRCTCIEEPYAGYQCANCGSQGLVLSSPECYVTKPTPHLHYPKCCYLEERCPGHPDYDASKIGGGVVG